MVSVCVRYKNAKKNEPIVSLAIPGRMLFSDTPNDELSARKNNPAIKLAAKPPAAWNKTYAMPRGRLNYPVSFLNIKAAVIAGL